MPIKAADCTDVLLVLLQVVVVRNVTKQYGEQDWFHNAKKVADHLQVLSTYETTKDLRAYTMNRFDVSSFDLIYLPFLSLLLRKLKVKHLKQRT